ncbi:hypothetical protein [Xanthomonas campestris]|uniref:hypothetical protein n=1 Tax=Xanthomonas campestris TaxID=339 RepID=UPI0009700FBD|nr:hypothetical protein [Xanthomonas campestris]WDK01423.1 hypothetical protein JH273_16615 [Xanthomonas campestris]WDK32781.1 hypothetical protein JH307_06130 [Xanthomonas campestris]WVL61814.1 hypothetical protein LLE68_005345 [Xanthomonas campestris pv. barbareae]
MYLEDALMSAPSLDVLAGQLVIAAWFIAFGCLLLIVSRRMSVRVRYYFQSCFIGSMVVGLLLAFLLPSSLYVLKFMLMLALAVVISLMGLKHGPRKYVWFGLLAVVLAYAAVALQYVLMETAR